jgi:undecaprenyl-diphosphatase
VVESFLTWFSEFGASSTAVLIMFANAVGESIILPVPCDLVLMALATIRPENSLWYGAITTIGSVAGAMIGYLIGKTGGRRVLLRLFAEDKVAMIDNYFEKYGVWAIFVAGFTPIPYKVFTIASGVAQFRFNTFVLVSLISRGLRFMAIAVLFFIFGAEIRQFLEEYLGPISWATLILVVVIFVIYLTVTTTRRRRRRLSEVVEQENGRG